MKLFKIAQGTEAVLLTNYEGVVTTKPWKARHDMEFMDANLVVDPVTLSNTKNPNPKSLGYQLAKKGYAVFIDQPGQQNKYALAVHGSQVNVIC